MSEPTGPGIKSELNHRHYVEPDVSTYHHFQPLYEEISSSKCPEGYRDLLPPSIQSQFQCFTEDVAKIPQDMAIGQSHLRSRRRRLIPTSYDDIISVSTRPSQRCCYNSQISNYLQHVIEKNCHQAHALQQKRDSYYQLII